MIDYVYFKKKSNLSHLFIKIYFQKNQILFLFNNFIAKNTHVFLKGKKYKNLSKIGNLSIRK